VKCVKSTVSKAYATLVQCHNHTFLSVKCPYLGIGFDTFLKDILCCGVFKGVCCNVQYKC